MYSADGLNINNYFKINNLGMFEPLGCADYHLSLGIINRLETIKYIYQYFKEKNMTTVLYIIIGILITSLIFTIKMINDKQKSVDDSSRQFAELRASYQKMEYSVTTAQAKINDLNSMNAKLQDELKLLMDNPMVNSSKVNKRIGK
jgi:hypothetical protein